MPAATRYVSFARLATAHLCGVVGLSVGRIADLRLVVDEACGQFMHGNAAFLDPETPEVPLELRFERRTDRLRITVRGPIPTGWPDYESLGWLVLEALVGDVDYEVEPEDGVGTLSFDEPLSADGVPGDVLWFATS
jgi:anti-sigma regulatory factor (Ser/Thr protein kinase)